MAETETGNASYLTRRIGGTVYSFRVVFSDAARETMEDKSFDFFVK